MQGQTNTSSTLPYYCVYRGSRSETSCGNHAWSSYFYACSRHCTTTQPPRYSYH